MKYYWSSILVSVIFGVVSLITDDKSFFYCGTAVAVWLAITEFMSNTDKHFKEVITQLKKLNKDTNEYDCFD